MNTVDCVLAYLAMLNSGLGGESFGIRIEPFLHLDL